MILIDVFVLTGLLSINLGVKTRACLLKAFFAFDFVGEWRPTVKRKGYKNLMTLKNVMDKLTSLRRNSFICRQQRI